MNEDVVKVVLLTIGGVIAFIVGSDKKEADVLPEPEPRSVPIQAELQAYDPPTVKVDGRDYCTGWIAPEKD